MTLDRNFEVNKLINPKGSAVMQENSQSEMLHIFFLNLYLGSVNILFPFLQTRCELAAEL